MYKYQEGRKSFYTKNVFGCKRKKTILKADCIKELFKSYDVTSLCCKAFKRSCLELEKDYSLFSNLNYGEDTLQSVEVYSNAQNIVYLNECLYKLDYNKNENIQYLKKIRNDSEVQKYISNFYKIRKNLKRQYIFLLTLFIKKQYTLLWFFLYLRNKV